MNFGWVKLHRKLWENPRSADPNWLSVWAYLLCHATHAERQAMFGHQVVTLKPGQLVTGRDVIAKATGVHRSSVERILQKLEIEQQIEQQTSTKNRLISIKNWEKYQGDEESEQQNEQPASNSRATSEHIQEWKEGKNGERRAPRRPRQPVTYEPSPQALLLFRAWKAHFPKDDAPRTQTCKNAQGRLQGHSLEALLFSVLAYRAAVTKEAEKRPEGVLTYKGSNFFGEKAYFENYLPRPDQLQDPRVIERLQAVKTAIENMEEK